MDRAASCRRAARDAVADVEPARLHDVIVDTLDGASMTPGVLTLESAAAIDPDADLEAVSHQAAGVQLIYEGLGLTRRLAHDEPWVGGGEPDPMDVRPDGSTHDLEYSSDGHSPDHESDVDDRPRDADADRSDLEILAADILVARGFYLLARTDAAGKAVRTVQAFGRDQTRRDDPEENAETLDGNLERDVLELAVLAGAAAVGSTPTAAQVATANDIADTVGTGFPPAETCVPVFEPLECGSGSEETDAESPPGDGVQTDRATSATDP